MDIRPILSTLLRHKTAAALIVLEIAVSCAIICNALFLIGSRLEHMDRASGLAEEEIVRVHITGIGTDDNAAALTREDLASLRAIPGVQAASATNQIPYGNSSWNSSVNLELDQPNQTLNAAVYLGEEDLVETFGLRIVEGRDFNPDEYIDWADVDTPGSDTPIPAMLVSRAAAQRLFPDESAVGKQVYSWGDNPIRIVGVVDQLIRPNEGGGANNHALSIMLPIRTPYGMGPYVLRTEPGRRTEVIEAALAALDRNNASRIVLDSDTFSDVRDAYYAQDRSMAWLLVAVCIALLVVTALGIVGLASFWVQQRTKQIGVRRALGATRGQVLRYFQTENFLLATVGIVLGMLMAYGINLLLMDIYELPRLPAMYLPVGAVALWLLGQAAVFGPARKAASVPPAVATRSV
ncbi:ABC transporter permease [Novilysobacter selenitireducens]|uniref:ABC transporter permease n=1 Tax=Novilysobacter selenitireducens TaxID=2872639 RepID=A0ABS7T8K9_9GAMM|nr:FtsX-like permease family protein [Lysobacter selenitireducens]MBZ4040226.1 ABC transporter permease [Lysobacter selenitireducens]